MYVYVCVGVYSRWLKMACVWMTCLDSVYSNRMSETWCWRPSGLYNLTTSHALLLNGRTAHYPWWRTSIQRYLICQLILSNHFSSCICYSFIFSKFFFMVMVTRLDYSLDRIPTCKHTFTLGVQRDRLYGPYLGFWATVSVHDLCIKKNDILIFLISKNCISHKYRNG